MEVKAFIPVSIGELIDRISILTIKEHRIKDPEKQKYIAKELSILKDSLKGNFSDKAIDSISVEVKALHEVNKTLWDIQDKLWATETKGGPFKKRFVKLARSVYQTNSERAKLKRAINLKFNSVITEEKNYVDYSELCLYH